MKQKNGRNFYEKNGDDAKQDGSSAGSRHDDNDVGGRSGRLYVRTGIGDGAVGGKYGDHGDESGENQAEPDVAEITYSVYSQAADASTCQSENQTDLDAVLALLKEKGIADTSVQTSGLGLNPIYDWDNGKKITGYEMTTEVVVSDVAIEDAGAIISDSVNAGINSIDSVQYQCSNFDEIYQEALKKAIESARVKAEAMAEAGGCKLGTMTNVQEYSSGQQARYYDTSYSSGMAMKETAMEDAGAGRNLMRGRWMLRQRCRLRFPFNRDQLHERLSGFGGKIGF
ncbi:SIMPL domain-containing protein [Clostridium sp. AF37-7]|uniref:SIMPL domain-containing protein n=1 Tax=Clostridium sp. AF37-7 TaxID=2293017 RepID=UPI000E53370F|nr:DUF541 domain-containing protein [Clostridium sp. AF37-7]